MIGTHEAFVAYLTEGELCSAMATLIEPDMNLPAIVP